MILIYRVFSTLIYPFLFFYIYYRRILGKEDPNRFKEKILISHFNVKKRVKSKLIWFHAASVGEFKSIIPIIDHLNKNYSNLELLITTTTVSSGNLAKIELERFNNVQHRYFPFDVPFLIDKFINLWKPDKIFLVDSEIWPNLIFKAKKYKTPIALINARLTFRSFKKWMIFSRVAKKIFRVLDLCICANNETKNFLEKLSAKNIYYKGNIKFVHNIGEKNLQNINEDFLIKKNFWVAASTHQEEDQMCIQTHLELKKQIKDLITIVAPRHIERAEKIMSLAKRFYIKAQILNKNEKISENNELIIINHYGSLPNYFKYAKSVFIGKSMVKRFKNDGGQNPIDAAKLKCNVYHGPYVYNFKEIYDFLEKNNVSKKIKTYKELSDHLLIDFKNSHVKNNEISNLIKSLGDEILDNTMKLVGNFLK